MTHITNAVITSASLNIESHDILEMRLWLGYGKSGQAFGGYILCVAPDSPHWPGKGNVAGVFIRRVFDVAGVRDFDQLKGRSIRVRLDKEYGAIQAIGHIINDLWFEPDVELPAIIAQAGG